MSVEETVEYYLDSMLKDDNQHEIIDQRTSRWIDDIRSVNIILKKKLFIHKIEYNFGQM